MMNDKYDIQEYYRAMSELTDSMDEITTERDRLQEAFREGIITGEELEDGLAFLNSAY